MSTMSPTTRGPYGWAVVCDDDAPFAPRDGGGAISFGGKMWLLGGWNPMEECASPEPSHALMPLVPALASTLRHPPCCSVPCCSGMRITLVSALINITVAVPSCGLQLCGCIISLVVQAC